MTTWIIIPIKVEMTKSNLSNPFSFISKENKKRIRLLMMINISRNSFRWHDNSMKNIVGVCLIFLYIYIFK